AQGDLLWHRAAAPVRGAATFQRPDPAAAAAVAEDPAQRRGPRAPALPRARRLADREPGIAALDARSRESAQRAARISPRLARCARRWTRARSISGVARPRHKSGAATAS